MLCIFVLILVLIILVNNFKKKENFYNMVKIDDGLSLVSELNGYTYNVGNNMGGSYDKPGFKESELTDLINDIEEHDSDKADKLRTILYKGKISNERMVPFIFAATKQLNEQVKKNIEEMNELRDLLQPIRENMEKVKACVIALDNEEVCTVFQTPQQVPKKV